MTVNKEFHVNKYLSVRLERGQTMIYVAGQRFIQCKFLLLNIPITETSTFDEIESIDEAAEMVNVLGEREIRKIEIPPEVRFWGHCSNLQVWSEYEYDTRLLHSNLAFPLLGKLNEMGDPLAKKKFKAELINRYKNGTEKTREYIQRGGALKYLSLEEWVNLLLDTEDLIALIEFVEKIWTDRSPYEIVHALIVEKNVKLENRKVVKLDLSDLDLELEEFPEGILKFRNLKALYLGSSYIKEIPERINKLCSIKELVIGSNEILHIPDSICEITSLEELWLGGNRIHTLPEKIGNLKLLKTLRLGSNEIKELPESFCQLEILENLSLANNRLEVLPDSFCNLTSLKWLSLSNNKLNKLPDCLINLQSLEYLDITENPLTESPELKDLKIKKIKGIEKKKFLSEYFNKSSSS